MSLTQLSKFFCIDETHQYLCGLKSNTNDMEVFVEKIGESTPEVRSSKNIKNKDNPIKLKVVSYGEYYDFYYSTHNSGWVKLCGDVDAYIYIQPVRLALPLQ